MENQKTIDLKNGSARKIRKAAYIIGIIACCCILAWCVLHGSAMSSYETYPLKEEEWSSYMKYSMTLVDVGRYVSMVGLFLSLGVAGLLITHAIMQLMRLNKTNLKWELTSGIINAIISLVIIAFTIAALTLVFNNAKWGYTKDDVEGSFYYGTKVHFVYAYMGILFATVFFATIYCGSFDRKGLVDKNTNIKSLRIAALAVFFLAIVSVLMAIFGFSYGFRNVKHLLEQTPSSSEEWNDLYAKYNETIASLYTEKFVLGATGAISLLTLSMIPCAILAFNDRNEKVKNIVIYSVLGLFTLVFFAVGAALLKMDDISISETPKFVSDTEMVSAMVLLSYVGALATGITTFVTTRKFDPKQPKAVKAA